MSRFLYGIHDPGGEHLMADKPGWIIHTVALREVGQFDYRSWADRGFTNIVRLNHGYNPHGTIPVGTLGEMQTFAKRCADFVVSSPGANIFIIGNEPNHMIEWPQQQKILPRQYAVQFNDCYLAIKQRSPSAQVMVAAPAPWNPHAGDWLAYYRAMLDEIAECDGLAIHGYTHGTHPDLIDSQHKVSGWYWHFPVIYQTIQAIPPKFANKPVHVTETDQGDDAWADTNSGWVRRAFQSINKHNKTPGTQKIMSLSLYRWQTHNNDKWHFNDKPGVQADFRDAVSLGFPSPAINQPLDEKIVLPVIKNEDEPKDTAMPEPTRNVDPRLVLPPRELRVLAPPLTPGGKYWFANNLKWLDEQEAEGRHHIYGNVYDERGTKLYGIKLKVTWPSDSTTVETKPDPVSPYSYNYPMSGSLKEYSIEVMGGATPSEKVTGIGMGHDGNSNIHTSTVVDFHLRSVGGASKPDPVVVPPPAPSPGNPSPTPSSGLVMPTVGVITQRWGQNPANYARFGQAGHNGLDIGAGQGTPVVSVADGVVVFASFDPDYGYYVRIYHPQLRLHSFYAHLQEGTTEVKVGQSVAKGQRIARVGSTGNSTGPHLHLEFRLGEKYNYAGGTWGYTQGRVDPEPILYIHGAKN